ncbi:hypothetical protein [Yersinia mollaretii]|uniref:hypothetical protein n=1 Tax=Yersinia mollaretii TaxID=33060 RepID=UPI0005E7E307|nr:hypothetical protein [Yersinia mollaretii]CQG98665.1 Uncharacterised protein [Yersinia mollaretii]
MNNDLDSFTVERLEELTALSFPPSHHELAALARIALAVKMAEPVAWFSNGAYYNTGRAALKDQAENPTPLYTTPQLNSPEIPEGWKLVPNMPTLGMLSVLGLTGSFESMLGRYADMLYAAPERENG